MTAGSRRTVRDFLLLKNISSLSGNCFAFYSFSISLILAKYQGTGSRTVRPVLRQAQQPITSELSISICNALISVCSLASFSLRTGRDLSLLRHLLNVHHYFFATLRQPLASFPLCMLSTDNRVGTGRDLSGILLI